MKKIALTLISLILSLNLFSQGKDLVILKTGHLVPCTIIEETDNEVKFTLKDYEYSVFVYKKDKVKEVVYADNRSNEVHPSLLKEKPDWDLGYQIGGVMSTEGGFDPGELFQVQTVYWHNDALLKPGILLEAAIIKTPFIECNKYLFPVTLTPCLSIENNKGTKIFIGFGGGPAFEKGKTWVDIHGTAGIKFKDTFIIQAKLGGLSKISKHDLSVDYFSISTGIVF